MSIFSRLTVVGVTLLLVGTLAPPAGAHGPDEGDDGSAPEGPEHIIPDLEVEAYGQIMTLAALDDYRLMAEERGITVAAAVDRFHWQHEFAYQVSQIADQFPNEYAGAAITNAGQAAWVAFRGTPPALAGQVAAGMPKPVTVIGGRGFSEAELAQVLEDHYYPILDRPDIVDGYGTSDPVTGVITITAQPLASFTTAQRQALQAELQPAPVSNPAISVQVLVDDVPGEMLSHFRGGAHAGLPNGSWCTWGFNVIPTTGGGGHGISIARHCTENSTASSYPLRYHTHGNGSSGTLNRVRWGNRNHGDMAFHRLSGHLVDGSRFYHDYRALRSTLRVARPVSGLDLCAYGRTTGRKCTNEVWRLNQCAGQYCRLTMTHRSRHSPGDSGGPWFSGNTAYGMTSHRKRVTTIWRDLFSPVSPNLQDLGVRVRTG